MVLFKQSTQAHEKPIGTRPDSLKRIAKARLMLSLAGGD